MEEKLTRERPQSSLYHHYNKIDATRRRGTEIEELHATSKRTILGQRPSLNRKAESEFGTTKFPDNCLFGNIKSQELTDHVCNWLVSWPASTQMHSFHLFHSGTCALFSFCFPTWVKLAFSHLESSSNFHLGESRTWRFPDTWNFLDHTGAGPAPHMEVVQ